MSIILKAENISKQYRLGLVGTGTLSHDLNRAWHRIRGKEDPYLKVGAINDRATKASENYVWALKEINFEVREGEVLGIIGKNGAGKSTLLKLLSRVTSPTTGVIKTRGRIASLLEVGTGFHPELTGKENIYLNGAILGMKRAEITEKLTEIIEFSGCEKYIDTPVKRYSSGMRVRLAFAVAAHLEPDILVIDEVLAVGDAEFQKKAIGKMQDISNTDGRTVLFVSHDMAAIKNLCNRLLVIDNGKINFDGDVDLGIEFYLNSSTSKEQNYIAKKETNIIQKVIFKNIDGSAINSIIVGQDISIEFYLNNLELSENSISIGFFDLFSNFLFACRSDIVNVVYDKDTKMARLVIEKWPLSAGSYLYNLAVYNRNTKLEGQKEAGIIDVERGDFYGTGKLPGHKKAFYVNYKWEDTNV